MKKKARRRKGQTLATWPNLSAELQLLGQRIDRGEDVDAPPPRLGINATLVPGEYWYFQPGWFNIRWWWEEITAYADSTRGALIKLQAYYVHERTLETIYLQNPEFHPTEKFNEHLASVARSRSSLTEEVAHRLFALREKMGWLIYEVISSLFPVYIEPRRVSYNSVRAEVDKLPPQGEHARTLTAIKDVFPKLDDEDIQALFSFRHGYVHRIRPRAGCEQPLLFLQTKKGSWDSLRIGKIRSRQLIHLASHAWLRLVKAIRALANVQLPPTGIVSNSAKDGSAVEFDPWFGLHSQIGIETEYGKLLVSCMKECRGFKAWFTPRQELEPVEFRTQEGKDCLNRVWETIKLAVPFFEPEKHAGFFKHNILNNGNEQLHLVLLTQDEAADPLAETFVERYGNIGRQEIAERGTFVDVAEVERLLPEMEGTKSWPDEARRALLDTVTGGSAYRLPIVREKPGEQNIVSHVAFRSPWSEDLEVSGTKIPSGSDRFILFEHSQAVRNWH